MAARIKYLVYHKPSNQVLFNDLTLTQARNTLKALNEDFAMMAQPTPNEALTQKELARRQKDMDGFVEKHQAILDARAKKYAQEIAPAWTRIRQNITAEIRNLYKEVEDAQGVPITEQPIKADKYRNMQRQMDRLRQLEDQLATMLGTPTHKFKMDRALAHGYAESYYFHAFGLEQAAQVAVKVPVLTAGHVIGAIINPWLPDGATYSDRLRANTAFLAKKMVATVEQGLGSGWSINRTAREIGDVANEGYYNAVRLARTEMNRAAAQGANHVYMQNADILDDKRWNATLDARTAPKDAQNDGEVFPLDYDTPENPGDAGRRIPNHPNCRCKWSPVLSALGISTKERIARGDGDSKKEFGERTYTKARSYKEYAEERGLPNVDDAVRNENPFKYLRRGETIDAVPLNFFDPYRASAAAVATSAQIIAGVEAVKAATAFTFTPARSIKEANEWAAQNIPEVATIDYTGYDVRVANEVNEELRNLYNAYPEIETIKYIGTAQNRNKLRYEWEKKEFLKANQATFAGYSQSTIDSVTARYVKVRKVDGNVMGQAANHTWGDQAGITLNQKYAKDYENFKEAVEQGVRTKWSPEGTEKPVSIMVHEFGHSIDFFLKEKGLRDKYLTPITKQALADPNLTDELCQYAKTNDKEVIAEAFAEYRCNPNPRKYARLIGEAIEQALNEYRGLK